MAKKSIPEQTKYRKLSDIKTLQGNPRILKDEQFEILCKSIIDNPEYFYARPLILSDRTGKLIIIAGNQRYKAAKELKLKEVPTFLMKGLTEEKEREIIVRDNHSNGEWDFDMLRSWDQEELIEWGLVIPDLKDPGEEVEEKIKEPEVGVFFLNIRCDSEQHCQQWYEKLIEEGLEVKIVT
jgi:hypothetical protein